MNEALKQKVDDLTRTLVRVALEHSPAALASSLSAEDMVKIGRASCRERVYGTV